MRHHRRKSKDRNDSVSNLLDEEAEEVEDDNKKYPSTARLKFWKPNSRNDTNALQAGFGESFTFDLIEISFLLFSLMLRVILSGVVKIFSSSCDLNEELKYICILALIDISDSVRI